MTVFLFYFDSSRKGEGEGEVKADCFENQKQNTKQNKKQKQRGGRRCRQGLFEIETRHVL